MARPLARIALAVFFVGVVAAVGALVATRDEAPPPALPAPDLVLVSESQRSAVEAPPSSGSTPTPEALPVSETSAPMVRVAAPVGTRCRLGGFVHSTASTAPLEHVYVGLYRPALEQDSPESEYGQWRGERDFYPGSRQLVTWRSTDEQGAFSFEDLDAGTYVVRCELGPLVVAATSPQTLVPGEVRGGLRIDLEPFGSVAGQLRVPPHVSFDGLRIALRRIDANTVPPVRVDGRLDDALERVVADDGTYRLGPALPGRHRVSLQRFDSRATSRVAAIVLGEVEIRAGEVTERDFDLVAGFPGTIRIRVEFPRLSDAWARHLNQGLARVVAVPSDTVLETDSASDRVRRGEAQLGPLAAGAWRITYHGPDGLAEWSMPSLVQVPVGETVDVTLAVPLVSAEVRFQDARTGAPLRDQTLSISTGVGDAARRSFVELDAEGRAQLALLPDDYFVAVLDLGSDVVASGARETLQWNDTGPRTPVVKLLLPDSAKLAPDPAGEQAAPR